MNCPPEASVGPWRPRILVADDDRLCRQQACACLLQLYCRPRSASHGRQALRLASHQQFQACLLDYHLPDMSACTLVARLRAAGCLAPDRPRLIAISAALDQHQRRKLAEAGFAGFLPKPLRMVALRDCLQGLPCPLLLSPQAMQAQRPPLQTEKLRRLLQAELQALAPALPELWRQPPALMTSMHRLQAGCRFCGASALAEQAAALERQLRDGNAPSRQQLHTLEQLLAATLQALQATRRV